MDENIDDVDIDSLFPTIKLNEDSIQELNEMKKLEYSQNEIASFVLSMKSDIIILSGDIPQATELAKLALSYNYKSIDAYRTLIMASALYVDIDTELSLCHQLIFLFKTLMLNSILNYENHLKKQLELKPYIRLLFRVSAISLASGIFDEEIASLEEILRLDKTNIKSANRLALAYVRSAGAFRNISSHHGDLVDSNKQSYLRVNSWIRSINDLHSLLNEFGELIQEDVMQLCNAVISFTSKEKSIKNWNNSVQILKNKFPYLISLIFGEEVPHENQCQYFHISYLSTWVDFIIDMHDLLYGANGDFYKHIHSIYGYNNNTGLNSNNTPSFTNSLVSDIRSRNGKRHLAKAGFSYLAKAREALKNQQYVNGMTNCTLAKRFFCETCLPSRHWYLSMPFPVISNRASASSHIDLWIISLHDARFTLKINPKHINSIVILMKIAAFLNCPSLQSFFYDEIKQAERRAYDSDIEWQNAANRCIGMSSLVSFVLCKEEKLSDSMIEMLTKVGIEDFYCKIPCSPYVLDTLSWVDINDM